MHEYKPECFIYNIDNFLLVGTDNDTVPLSINRTTNLPKFEYILSNEEDFVLNLQKVKKTRG